MPQDFETYRKNMIEGQLRPNKITHPGLIAALYAIPREKFVPREMQGLSYIDEDIAIGNGRYLPEPMVLTRLLQEAEITPNDIVLDIGCGTGYSSALLGHVAGTVVGIEEDQTMAQEADRLLHDLDICNAVVIQQKDLRDGYAQQGPYNVILINGSVPAVPHALQSQLAEGGRLVTIVANNGHMGTAVRVTRTGNFFATQALFDAAAPMLSSFKASKTFTF